MKNFNIEDADIDHVIVIREGKNVKILLYDRDSKQFPIVVIIENRKVIQVTKKGKYYLDRNSKFDLMIDDEKE